MHTTDLAGGYDFLFVLQWSTPKKNFICAVGAIRESPLFIFAVCGRFVNRPYK
ncbi:MAG: hypothetical protein IKB41_02660 [Clostridia bacterium]|nr:hypothetical protein [Clostridia bacterium]